MSDKKLDAKTLLFVAQDLEQKASFIVGLNATKILGEKILGDLSQYAETFYALSKYYLELAHAHTEPTEPVPDVKKVKTTKRPRGFLAQAISFVMYESTPSDAKTIVRRIESTDGALKLLGRVPTIQQVQDALSAHSRGSNPRYLRITQGKYILNKKYKLWSKR